MIDLGDEAVTSHLHSGCALLVGTIGADGQPWASRGWGLTVIDADAGRLRLLVEADDPETVARLRAGGRVAITATSVINFKSIQVKGRGVAIVELTEDDQRRRDQYVHDLVHDIHSVEGYAKDVLESWARRRVVPCIVEVDTSFDQTPGPSAGAAVDRGTA